MSYKFVDKLQAYQIEPGDLLKFDDYEDPVTVTSMDILEDGYQINFLDEYYDEVLSQVISEDAEVDLYAWIDD